MTIAKISQKHRGPILISALSVISLAISGCMVGADYQAPANTAPAQFGEAHHGPSTQPVLAIDLTRYWTTFKDPELSSLIDRAIKNNNILLQAEARVRQARAQLGVEWGNEFPTLGVDLSATRTQASKTLAGAGTSSIASTANNATSGGAVTGAGGTTSGGTTGGTTNNSGTSSTVTGTSSQRRIELYNGSFDAGWEIDIFGGDRRAIRAAEDDLEAQVDSRRNALVTLTSEVANDYMLLRAYQAELKLTLSNMKSENSTLDLTKARFKAGLVSDLDVAQAQASVATTAAQLPTQQIEIQQEIHAISILLGEPPMALVKELETESPIPPTPPEIPVGIPAELLRRRPDVRNAERLLAEQTENIGVAVANLFPKFSLTGSLGQESSRFGLTARSASTIWSFGPTVSWQILDWNQLRSQVRVANAIQAQALYNYHQVVLQSYGDVEDALVAYTQDQVRTRTLQDEVNAYQRATDLSLQLYNRGLGDFLNVLTAERSLYTAQSDFTSSQSNVATDLVRLYKALGGGWDEQHEEMFQKNENPTIPINFK